MWPGKNLLKLHKETKVEHHKHRVGLMRGCEDEIGNGSLGLVRWTGVSYAVPGMGDCKSS